MHITAFIVVSLLAFIHCRGQENQQGNNSSSLNHDEDNKDGSDIPKEVESNATSIQFLLLGDWGKGGSTGKYGSSIGVYMNETQEQTRTTNVATTFSDTSQEQDSSDSEETNVTRLQLTASGDKNGGATGGGGGGQKNTKTYYQVHIAKAMATFAASTQPAPSFVLALGDNFYSNGVSSATDILWDYLWKDVYINNYPQLNIPWYPVFGNHDYGGGASAVRAQIERYQAHEDDDIWMFPATNYTKRFTIPGNEGGSVVIVFVDTTTLAPSVNKCCNQNGGISTEEQQRRIKDQLQHIERMLQEAVEEDPPSWLLVVGHYPIFSAGSVGDVLELSTYLLPLLVKYKVHAYICGHDHISEHLKRDGIEYFVAGAGSMTDQLKYSSQAELVWYGVGYSAYASMEATAEELTITYRDWNNTERYSYTLTNPFLSYPSKPGDGIFDIQIPGIRSNRLNNLMVTVSCGGVALIGVALLLYLYKERTNMVKRTKDPKVLDLSEEEFLYAISPNRRRNGRHHFVYKSVGNTGIELIELGILKDHHRNKNLMASMSTTTTIDTTKFKVQDVDKMDTQSLVTLSGQDRSNPESIFSTLTIDAEEDESQQHSMDGYIRVKTNVMGHRRTQTSPI